jgi:hypothetical protein
MPPPCFRERQDVATNAANAGWDCVRLQRARKDMRLDFRAVIENLEPDLAEMGIDPTSL